MLSPWLLRGNTMVGIHGISPNAVGTQTMLISCGHDCVLLLIGPCTAKCLGRRACQQDQRQLWDTRIYWASFRCQYCSASVSSGRQFSSTGRVLLVGCQFSRKKFLDMRNFFPGCRRDLEWGVKWYHWKTPVQLNRCTNGTVSVLKGPSHVPGIDNVSKFMHRSGLLRNTWVASKWFMRCTEVVHGGEVGLKSHLIGGSASQSQHRAGCLNRTVQQPTQHGRSQ